VTGLEGQADDLPASLTPEKFVEIVPEKETDLSRVLANLYDIELFQTIHQLPSTAPLRIFWRHA
jgi:hypothetical protein